MERPLDFFQQVGDAVKTEAGAETSQVAGLDPESRPLGQGLLSRESVPQGLVDHVTKWAPGAT